MAPIISDHRNATGKTLAATKVHIYYYSAQVSLLIIEDTEAGDERKLNQAATDFCTLHCRTPFALKSYLFPVLIWREEGTRYYKYNIIERRSYRGGGIMVLDETSPGINIFQRETLTAVRYWNAILAPHTGFIGGEFII